MHYGRKSTPDKTFGTSVVYFIMAEGTDRVKIGVSEQFEQRLIDLQVGSAVRLKVLGTIPGD